MELDVLSVWGLGNIVITAVRVSGLKVWSFRRELNASTSNGEFFIVGG